MHTYKALRWTCYALALATFGCARHPAVVTGPTLPLRRVVVYRNGIGYFERAGHVAGDEVRFRVQQSEVGDFLSTLAVMEQGGSTVRSAAFPMPPSEASDAPPDPSAPRAVRLALDGMGHDLTVGYTVETPIWRPSYRLVFDAHGHTQLQAWGIVQNLSGEDWTNVHLSLMAGSPVSFRSELATAMIPSRPEVTDRGAVIDAVPTAETTLAQGQTVSSPPAPPPFSGEDDAAAIMGGAVGGVGAAEHRNRRDGVPPVQPTRIAPRTAAEPPSGYGHGMASAPGARRGMPRVTTAQAGPAAPPPLPPPSSSPRNIASLAALAAQGGTTRYDLPNTVTIPDHSATMVMLVAREIPGSQTYLFAPDAGVPASYAHPFHVARFENRTGALLERGPLAIFEANAFLGEGLLEPLPDGASAAVPFALERGLSVEKSQTGAVEGSHLIRVLHDAITIERYSVQRMTYTVRNGLDVGVQVMVRESLPDGVTIFQPSVGTEHSNGAALVPIHVDARGHNATVVTTRRAFTQSVDWTNEEAASAIRDYLRDGHPATATATALQSALDLRTQLVDQQRQRDGIAQQQADIVQSTNETRENLYAIEHNARAADLRAHLTTRLALLARQNDQITRQLVELDTGLSEHRVRLAETVREIDIDTTHPVPPTLHP